ncbi:cupin domain-containing protein [Mangrovivirga sp. M17]|uniref:Cupin domain-containing protein n=1 Tax=Mangrovivirga halotolerans TaxID=2993936 RepID=A0ABT3RQI0_9BACT|nr:cupin domain-containing protein [Mangrovivirga halotolerans]MCX2744044.1 cupin domain-containing protein [Mangrovivirga halotolerans]
MNKGTVLIIDKIVEYNSNAINKKTIIKKTTGNITAISFDKGEELTQNSLPFDTFIQVIDGKTEVTIDKKSSKLLKGEAIIIPAHSIYTIKANDVRCKIIATIIKSGYENLSLN